MNESISALKNNILDRLSQSDNIDSAINTVIAMVGEYFQVDRVYIFENSEDNLCCNNTYEWCSEGITPEKDNLQNLRYLEDLGGEWIDNYDENGMFFCPSVEDLPEKQRMILEPQGIFSMLQCSIKEQGAFKGYIGFDNCQDHLGGWETDKEAVDALVFVSRLLSIYLLEYRNKQHLLERNMELEYANRAKSSFLSRMSHELRTPLNVVTGYSALLAENLEGNTLDKAEKREIINSIHRASEYLLEIVGDALDLQAIDRGQMKLNKSAVNFAELTGDVTRVIGREADHNHLMFTFEKCSEFEEYYQLDGIRLQQVLLNLLHNALKFTPEGGAVKMTAEAISQDDHYTNLKFTISDTGIGMTEEFLQTGLYNAFAQENQNITSPYSGCGMGLAICKEIITQMHGWIHCTSTLGEGTTFTFAVLTRPVKKRQSHSHSFDREKRQDLQGIRVLLCEDNPINQDMEKRMLSRMNCTVDIAENGKIGCERFLSSSCGYYSAILMDIRMPEMDGLEAARTIRGLNRPDAKAIPILAVSANAFQEDIQKSLEAGMNEHLSKPVSPRLLHDKIAHYCRLSS